MQIKKKKFLIGTLLSLTSVGIVGSIAGTLAWYTYNTKDTLMYHGLAVASNENLEFRLYDAAQGATEGWKTSISSAELIAHSEANGYGGEKLGAISFKNSQAKNAKLGNFVGAFEPYTVKAPSDATALKGLYLKTVIEFKCSTIDDPTVGLEKDIYISHMNVKATSEGKDITKAVRVHFDQGGMTDDDKTLVAPGYVSDGTTNLYGKYDMDNSGILDHGYLLDADEGRYFKDEADEDPDHTSEDLIYGVQGQVESYYGTNSVIQKFVNGKKSGSGRKIITTDTSATNFKQLTLTIWVDGWDPACSNLNANCEFDLNMTFQCESGNIN